MTNRVRAAVALSLIALLPACSKDEPSARPSASPTTSASASPAGSESSTPTATASSSSTPAASTSESPSESPTESAPSSPTESAPEPSATPVNGVPAGRLGANFVAVFEDDGVRQLGLFAKRTGMLVNDLGATVGPDDAQPQAAPDGKHIYFVHGSGDACDSGLYRVPIAGGGAQRLVDPQQQIEAFALDDAGTAIQAVRVANCGTGQAKRVLSEYDAGTGALVADRDLPVSPATAITRLAWHAESGLIAAARTGKGAVDTVETFELRESDVTDPYELVLPACLGRIRSVRFITDALYIARDCMNPENAAKAGHIYRNELGMEQLQTVQKTATGTSVAGLHVDESGKYVFSTVRWLEEDDEGPTTGYSVSGDGAPAKLFETPKKLTELAW